MESVKTVDTWLFLIFYTLLYCINTSLISCEANLTPWEEGMCSLDTFGVCLGCAPGIQVIKVSSTDMSVY